MCLNDIIIFNEKLENLATEIIEQTNIDESSHEQAILIFYNKNRIEKLKIDIL